MNMYYLIIICSFVFTNSSFNNEIAHKSSFIKLSLESSYVTLFIYSPISRCLAIGFKAFSYLILVLFQMENAKSSPRSVLLLFSQSYVKHDLRKNKIAVPLPPVFLALVQNLRH
jgi:hypothetical protein